MKSETPREIASELVSKWVPVLERRQPNYLHPFIDAIEAVLNAERERAAKIADKRDCQESVECICGSVIADEIRGKD